MFPSRSVTDRGGVPCVAGADSERVHWNCIFPSKQGPWTAHHELEAGCLLHLCAEHVPHQLGTASSSYGRAANLLQTARGSFLPPSVVPVCKNNWVPTFLSSRGSSSSCLSFFIRTSRWLLAHKTPTRFLTLTGPDCNLKHSPKLAV